MQQKLISNINNYSNNNNNNLFNRNKNILNQKSIKRQYMNRLLIVIQKLKKRTLSQKKL